MGSARTWHNGTSWGARPMLCAYVSASPDTQRSYADATCSRLLKSREKGTCARRRQHQAGRGKMGAFVVGPALGQ